MGKQYSKKQIQEAIKYWQNVLKQMNESKSELLNVCSKEFGNEIVFDDVQSFEFNQNNVNTLFNVLDNELFNRKLSSLIKQHIYVGSSSKLNLIATSYAKNRHVDLSKFLGLYQPNLDFKVDVNGHLNAIKHNEAIFINTDDHKFATFAYAIATLCHEMIHCYDANYGTLLPYTALLVEKKAPSDVINYLSHFTPTFKKFSNIMKDNNIDIRISGDELDYDELNTLAASKLKLLREDDDLSEYKPFIFDDKLKEKYDGFMVFNSPSSAVIMFGQNN